MEKSAMHASERKLIELTQKVASLGEEFREWRAKSEAREFLEKHYTQIRRITAQMEGYRGMLEEGLDQLRKNPEQVLAASAAFEGDIGEVHRIWDFFRNKFLQRCVSYYQSFLYPADEFAWACYEPAQQRATANGAAIDRVKEPPLVYFHFGADLLASRRNGSYESGLSGGTVAKKKFIDILQPLPIPLIGFPGSRSSTCRMSWSSRTKSGTTSRTISCVCPRGQPASPVNRRRHARTPARSAPSVASVAGRDLRGRVWHAGSRAGVRRHAARLPVRRKP